MSIYESAFNGSPVASVLLSASSDPKILAVNDAALQVFSRRRDELVGKQLFEAFPANPNDQQDSGRAAMRMSLAQVIDTRTVQTLPEQRYPIPVIKANGETCFEERFWSATNSPICDQHGTLTGIFHTTVDITEQALVETALRESEERLRAYILATSDVVYRMSPDWKYMHGLDGRGFLRTTTDWAEWPMEEYVHPDDQERARAAINKAIREKSVFELEHRVHQADGSYGWTYSRAVPRIDASGEIFLSGSVQPRILPSANMLKNV